jgi:hypothetical protein
MGDQTKTAPGPAWRSEESDEERVRAPRGPGPRKCLMCGREFESEGSHNRICRRCKSSQTYRGA